MAILEQMASNFVIYAQGIDDDKKRHPDTSRNPELAAAIESAQARFQAEWEALDQNARRQLFRQLEGLDLNTSTSVRDDLRYILGGDALNDPLVGLDLGEDEAGHETGQKQEMLENKKIPLATPLLAELKRAFPFLARWEPELNSETRPVRFCVKPQLEEDTVWKLELSPTHSAYQYHDGITEVFISDGTNLQRIEPKEGKTRLADVLDSDTEFVIVKDSYRNLVGVRKMDNGFAEYTLYKGGQDTVKAVEAAVEQEVADVISGTTEGSAGNYNGFFADALDKHFPFLAEWEGYELNMSPRPVTFKFQPSLDLDTEWTLRGDRIQGSTEWFHEGTLRVWISNGVDLQQIPVKPGAFKPRDLIQADTKYILEMWSYQSQVNRDRGQAVFTLYPLAKDQASEG